LYGVPTKRLNEQVKRNKERFPPDFLFQLTAKEFAHLKSQNATASWGGRRTHPYAFTEHGTLMAAQLLKTPVAVAVSIAVVRTFVRLRKILDSHKDLARKLAGLEKRSDQRFKAVFDLLERLMAAPKAGDDRQIGFRVE